MCVSFVWFAPKGEERSTQKSLATEARRRNDKEDKEKSRPERLVRPVVQTSVSFSQEWMI